VLNAINARLKLGFIGDLMEMRGRTLQIAPRVHRFFSDCDYLVGNLEGTITAAPKTRLDAQRHDQTLLDAMAGLFPPERTHLSVANNHAGDFAPTIFRSSITCIEDRGFRIFGLRAAPFAEITGGVQIGAASLWSNRPCKEIAPLAVLDECSGNPTFRIAFPHWGYELEQFPRPDTVRAGHKLLGRYGAVIGHHPHVPQPVTALRHGSAVRLLAFSLGNFCTGLRFQKFRRGVIMKLDVGPGQDTVWRIGAVQWRRTLVEPIGRGAVLLNVVCSQSF
jgi:poly-gamma-glutamate capsule biosynthesis protein CapA/YwtB (metallophosphatase superfamily)